jgi:hypothetical protein
MRCVLEATDCFRSIYLVITVLVFYYSYLRFDQYGTSSFVADLWSTDRAINCERAKVFL